MANTINGWIYFHPALVVALYLAITMICVIYVIRWRKKVGLKHAIRKGIVVSFCSAAIIYGLLSEIIWVRWLVVDVAAFQYLNNETKPVGVEGDLYQFVLECKAHLAGKDYLLLSNPGKEDTFERYFRDKIEYYLLPSRKKTDAEYIVVLFDNRVWFDQKTGYLYGNSKMPKVTLVYRYSPDAYLLRVLK